MFTALFNNSSSTKKVYTINSQSGIIKCEYDGKESIQIVNSYSVKSREEKYAILNGYLPVEVIVPWYPGEIIASLASGRDNPTESSLSVDFSVSGGDSLGWWYDIVTLGGVISW